MIALNCEPEITTYLRDRFGKLTSVQERVIPIILENKDVLVKSPTGTGKTLAYLVPVFHGMLTDARYKALVITPTRELSKQVYSVVHEFNSKWNTICAIGGSDVEKDIAQLDLSSGSCILVATPGRLTEIILSRINWFSDIKALILDEADKLLGLGFESVILNIMSKIGRKRVTSLFSATIDDKMKRIIEVSLTHPTLVDMCQVLPSNLKARYILIKAYEKVPMLFNIISKYSKTIVFFNTCFQVDLFSGLFSDVQKWKIHSKLTQDERNLVYNEFISADAGVIFCTDIGARGLDFKGVNCVVHFDCPIDPSNFVHRSGRTARCGSVGECILFIMENERDYLNYLKISSIDIVKMDPPPIQLLELCVDEKLARKSLVSYIRSYKEYYLRYLFNYKELNTEDLCRQFFLKELPRLSEFPTPRNKLMPKAPMRKTLQPRKPHKKRQCGVRKGRKMTKVQKRKVNSKFKDFGP